MTRLRALWERVRGTYWAVPSAMAAASVVFSIAMIEVDRALTAQLSWLYTGGPEGARAVLSTIAASMITVAGVVFSITIVALTLASQQFGPRLLRNFLRDLGTRSRSAPSSRPSSIVCSCCVRSTAPTTSSSCRIWP